MAFSLIRHCHQNARLKTVAKLYASNELVSLCLCQNRIVPDVLITQIHLNLFLSLQTQHAALSQIFSYSITNQFLALADLHFECFTKLIEQDIKGKEV